METILSNLAASNRVTIKCAEEDIVSVHYKVKNGTMWTMSELSLLPEDETGLWTEENFAKVILDLKSDCLDLNISYDTWENVGPLFTYHAANPERIIKEFRESLLEFAQTEELPNTVKITYNSGTSTTYTREEDGKWKDEHGRVLESETLESLVYTLRTHSPSTVIEVEEGQE